MKSLFYSLSEVSSHAGGQRWRCLSRSVKNTIQTYRTRGVCGFYCRVREQPSMSERVDGNTPRNTHGSVNYSQTYSAVKPHPNRKESPRIESPHTLPASLSPTHTSSVCPIVVLLFLLKVKLHILSEDC